MSLDNLILHVTYDENSPQYGNLLSHIISYSPSMGTIASSASNMHTHATYLFNQDGSPVSRHLLYARIADINAAVCSKCHLENVLDKYYDFEGTEILDSKYKFLLPQSVRFSPFEYAKRIPRLNADYTGIEYAGILENVMHTRPELLDVFSHNISLELVDTAVNAHLGDSFVNLYNSSNFCQTILEHIAYVRGEEINIDQAMAYFVDKPLCLVTMCIDLGINYIMNNGYAEYKNLIVGGYTNTVSHRGGVSSIKMKTLILPDINLSRIAYDTLYSRFNLEKNDAAFAQWHAHMFNSESYYDETAVGSLINIIAKLMTGQDFNLKKWNWAAQVILDCALKEKLGVLDGPAMFKQYIDA
jgi:hypothetical protein